MKKPNIYQMRHHCSHLKKEAVSLACARDAIAELAELGLTATSFSLGLRATITVKEPPYDTALTVPMRFTPVSIGFNGVFIKPLSARCLAGLKWNGASADT